ncbi:metal-binding protein [Calidithermus timidus]|uniref:metal-binding protein n=1 Tax=Calidithermus timidus TaxID=307124 RepID=UPI000373C122|nr:metal-binding protein [Calidithermus timidus]
MPSGRVHETINLCALGLGSAGYLAFKGSFDLEDSAALAFVASYCVGTFLITPDLDLAERNVRAKGRWGLLGWIWVPYGLMFSHRGLSHTWFIGPLTRLAYLFLLGGALLWAGDGLLRYWGASLELQGRISAPPGEILGAMTLGYYVSQWLHLIADGIWPDFPRRLRR